MNKEPRRWDTDERQHGIASGAPLLPQAQRLIEHLRRDGRIAEPGFFVRQVDENTIDCATGVFDGDPPGFASHGHLIRLIINRPGQ